MHEHNITNEVVHQVLHACEDSGVKNPKIIKLNLGLLSGYKKDPILFYFEQIKKEYAMIRDAKLEITEISGKIFCGSCKKIYEVEPSPIQICPECDSTEVRILQGKDITITEIK